MKLLKKCLFAAFLTALLAFLFPSDSLAANKVKFATVDGIEFFENDVVFFKNSFKAYTSSTKKKTKNMPSGYYTFSCKITDKVNAPYKFSSQDGKFFYIKESVMPRDYFFITYYSNGGDDKRPEKYIGNSNENGGYTFQIPFYKAENANLANVGSLFKKEGVYVNPGMAWLVNSKHADKTFNQNNQNMSGYAKWGKGPVYIDLYANWNNYSKKIGINKSKYIFVNNKGILSSVEITPSKKRIPGWIDKNDYVWTIPSAHSDQGKMRAKGIEAKTDKKGNVVLKGAKTIEYYVDESCRNGTNIITLTAGDYVQKFKIYTYRWRAHRGYMDKFPENTIEAFIAACEAGAISIETDIQVTKDGEIVCFHDKNLKIMDSGFLEGEQAIPNFTWSEVKWLFHKDANGLHSDESIKNIEIFNRICREKGYDNENYQSGQVCKFEDFLRICNYYGIYPTIELKIAIKHESNWEEVWPRYSLFRVGDLLRKYGFDKNNCVIGYYAKTDGGLMAGFSQETGYEYTVFWTNVDPDNRDPEDYLNKQLLQGLDPNITNIGTLSNILGGDSYRVRSPKEGYNVAFGQTGRGWKTFRY